MKILTYNILEGGKKRLSSIIRIIEGEHPDVVCLQEANGFEKNGQSLLKKLAKQLKLPNFSLSPSSKYNFNEVTFSRYPFSNIVKLPLHQNAALFTDIETELGKITLINAHPCPNEESKRIKEIKKILKLIPQSGNAILVGDMNSLSPHDPQPNNLIEKLSDHHKTKYTQNGKVVTKVIALIEKSGLTDVAVYLGKNNIRTAPTGIDLNERYSIHYTTQPLRLDYVFVSKPLVKLVKSYKVIRNETTKYASDHFPLTVDLNF